MTIKEKFKAEVERLKELYGYDNMTNVGSVVCAIFEKLLSFIDSITEEPVSKELNQAAEEYAKGEGLENALGGWEDMSDAFKAGAQWQKQQDSKLPHIHPRDTIEEYAYQCAYDISNDWAKETPEWKDVQTACVLGAQWQKEKDSTPSKDLEELINKLSGQFPDVSFAKLSRIAVRVAKWQRMQDVELN